MVMAFAVLLCSCEKPAEYEGDLGFLSHRHVLGSGSGSTPVVVYSNTSWTVRPLEKVDWASVDRFEGYGYSQVRFDYAANYGQDRSVRLEFSTQTVKDTVEIYQEGVL